MEGCGGGGGEMGGGGGEMRGGEGCGKEASATILINHNYSWLGGGAGLNPL